MKHQRLTGLSIAAALVSTTALVGCGEAEPLKRDVGAGQVPMEASATAPKGSEGGEGEGGVSIAAAASDPVVYRSALAIAKAHVLAARDAYAAGEVEAASEMFAHPAAEVMFEMEPILKARGVKPFSDMFLDASDAVAAGESRGAIAQRTTQIITALDQAAKKAPTDSRTNGQVAAGVVADQIDRAADMYRIAKETQTYEPYLDGYGFYKAARLAYEDSQVDIAGTSPTLIAIIEDALVKLEASYPAATYPASLDEDPASLRAVSSRLMLGLS